MPRKRVPRRRPKGSGTVYQRASDGRWVAALTDHGTEYREYAATPEQAELLRQALVRRRDAGTLAASPAQSVAAWLTYWLDDVQVDVRYHTRRAYARSIAYLTPLIGTQALESLTPQHITRALRRMEDEGRGTATVLMAYRVLRAALNHATATRVIAWNPMAAVKSPRASRRSREALTQEDLRRLLAVLGDDHYGPLVLVLALTGLRISEALGVQWSAVDWTGRTLDIHQQLEYRVRDGYYLAPLKSAASIRTVHLDAASVGALHEQQRRQVILRRRLTDAGTWTERGLTFTTPEGQPVSQTAVGTALARLCGAASLERITAHQLRHTYATLLLDAGHSWHAVSEELGHADIAVTMREYGHVVKGRRAELAQAMGALAGGPRWGASDETASIDGQIDCQAKVGIA